MAAAGREMPPRAADPARAQSIRTGSFVPCVRGAWPRATSSHTRFERRRHALSHQVLVTLRRGYRCRGSAGVRQTLRGSKTPDAIACLLHGSATGSAKASRSPSLSTAVASYRLIGRERLDRGEPSALVTSPNTVPRPASSVCAAQWLTEMLRATAPKLTRRERGRRLWRTGGSAARRGHRVRIERRRHAERTPQRRGNLAGVTFHRDLRLAGLDGDQAVTFFAREELTSPVSFEVAPAEADRMPASTYAGGDGVSAVSSEYARPATGSAPASPERYGRHCRTLPDGGGRGLSESRLPPTSHELGRSPASPGDRSSRMPTLCQSALGQTNDQRHALCA